MAEARVVKGGAVIACSKCGRENRIPFSRIADSARCGMCKSDLGSLSVPIEIPSAAEFDSLIDSSPIPVLVDFWAPWCAPCRMMSPQIQTVADTRQGQLVVAKVNTEKVPALAARFNVTGIPLLMLFRNGREISRLPGARPAADIQRFVDQASRQAA